MTTEELNEFEQTLRDNVDPGCIGDVQRLATEIRQLQSTLDEQGEILDDCHVALLDSTHERDEAREVARELWHWARWNDGIANAACACETIEEVEEIRVACLEEYEGWRSWREGESHRYLWLRGNQ